MLGQHFGTILARTDPFDVAQGLERYIRSVSAAHVRALISGARDRMNEWYRAEFLPLLDESDDERLKKAFTHTLKSNLRAIPLFGPAFCEGVISHVPGDRAIALGEEGYSPLRRVRPAAIGIVALAALIGAAAAQHVLSNARATAQMPTVIVTPVPVIAQPAPPVRAVAAAAQRRPAAVRPAPTRAATPTPAPQVAIAPQPAAPQHVYVPVSAVRAIPRRAQPVSHAAPAGRGVKTIVVQATPRPTLAPSDVNVDDMPQSYSDATPLPQNETPPPAQVAAPQSVPTPTPGPNRNWLHSTVKGVTSTIMHIDPFKPHPKTTPSPYGPNPQ